MSLPLSLSLCTLCCCLQPTGQRWRNLSANLPTVTGGSPLPLLLAPLTAFLVGCTLTLTPSLLALQVPLGIHLCPGTVIHPLPTSTDRDSIAHTLHHPDNCHYIIITSFSIVHGRRAKLRMRACTCRISPQKLLETRSDARPKVED